MEPLRVLVIDDSATIRAMLEQIVEREPGCRVVGVASDAGVARQLLESLLPNVITLDLAMPGMNGIEFLDELNTHRHPPVVVISSLVKHGSSEWQEALDHGAAACFDKSALISNARGLMNLLSHAVKLHRNRSATS